MNWLLRGSALGFCVAIMLAAGVVRAAEDAVPVTSDTADYCVQLAELLDEVMLHTGLPPPPPVQVLSQQGRQMCGAGHVRAGIVRLRRALMMLRQRQGVGGG